MAARSVALSLIVRSGSRGTRGLHQPAQRRGLSHLSPSIGDTAKRVRPGGQTPRFDVTVPHTRSRGSNRGGATSEVRMADQAHVDEGVMGKKLPTPGESRAAKWAGWFMAITFLTSIPALLLYHSIFRTSAVGRCPLAARAARGRQSEARRPTKPGPDEGRRAAREPRARAATSSSGRAAPRRPERGRHG